MRPIATPVVAWSVCVFETLVSPAKTAEPIKMPFGTWARAGLGKHVLDEGRDHSKWAILGRGRGHPIVKYRDHGKTAVSIKMRLARELARTQGTMY